MKKAEREQMLKEKLASMKQIENELRSRGFRHVGGVDEVGRGPLAGPVVAACVILPEDFDVIGVDDSKKLSAKKRKSLASAIKEKALAYGLGKAGEKVIDEINILEATRGAMRVAVDKAAEMLKERTGEDLSYVLFDAVTLREFPYPQRAIIKGDSRSVAIAAASILAKVTRDAMMVDYNGVYPGYAFDSNKGYGTKAHYEGLDRQGPCPIHRQSFLKSWKEKNRK
ncbi:MAG: ribonuclease HII [Eubacteriaceae bacterium]|nr:ribonuclease HII [Eubacteriaceae bacterium]